VSINPVKIQGRAFDYVVITRKSCLRAGTRYNTRGVDVEGNVANFNETEQIVFEERGAITAYLQTRGFGRLFHKDQSFVCLNVISLCRSIPIFWRQQINVKYQPQMIVEPVKNSVSSLNIYIYFSSFLLSILESSTNECLFFFLFFSLLDAGLWRTHEGSVSKVWLSDFGEPDQPERIRETSWRCLFSGGHGV
jgi:hypothetical protein